MGKTLKYVKEFDFGPQKTFVKGYFRGGYAKGGKSCDEPGYAKGGMKEPSTGESYSSRAAMLKHERRESPRMEREEVMKKTVAKDVAPKGGLGMVQNRGSLGVRMNKNPGERRGVPVAPNLPMIPPGAGGMKKGGAVPKKGAHKVGKVMKEFAAGKLHSGSKSGPIVKNPKQAIAIGISEARAAARKK